MADQLFYEHGYENTSFADIAHCVGISRGNFYYHFKTKDEILDEVIKLRVTKTRLLLAEWDQVGETPRDRIGSFINILIMNRVKIKRFGCPVGTLCAELSKLDHALLGEANKLFSIFREWLQGQFQLLGRDRDADELAMHVLGFSQGVATLANTFQDENFIHTEVNRMELWLDNVAEGKLF